MKLSVIIPVYNQQDLILKAIQSVPKSDNIEIIIIDDGSTDNTLDTILDYMSIEGQGEQIKLLGNPENKGVGYTINRGLDAAIGEYIVLLGSDDHFLTNNLEQVLEQADGTDLIYFNLRVNDGSILEINEETKNGYCGSVKLMRREFIGDIRNPEIRVREDLDFYNQLIAHNPTEKFTDIVAKHYNFPRENSLTAQFNRGEL